MASKILGYGVQKKAAERPEKEEQKLFLVVSTPSRGSNVGAGAGGRFATSQRPTAVHCPIHWIRYAPSAGRTCINNQIRGKASQSLPARVRVHVCGCLLQSENNRTFFENEDIWPPQFKRRLEGTPSCRALAKRAAASDGRPRPVGQ